MKKLPKKLWIVWEETGNNEGFWRVETDLRNHEPNSGSVVGGYELVEKVQVESTITVKTVK